MAHAAAQTGNLDALLEFGDVSCVLNEHKETVLHTAARFGHLSIVNHILERYPQLVSAINSTGRTALHHAVEKQHVDVVKKLVSFAKDLSTIGKLSPLQIALRNGFWQAVVLMITYQPLIFSPSMVSSQDLFHHAVHGNDVTTMRYLLSVCPKDYIKVPNLFGSTPLHLAVRHGLLSMVQLIVENDPTTVDAKDPCGSPPIFEVRDVSMLNFLYQLSPHALKHRSEDNRNLLQFACDKYRPKACEVVQRLLELCPDMLNELTSDRQSPVHFAFANNHKQHLNAMLRCKPAFVAVDAQSNNVLHMAVQMCTLDVVLAVFRNCPSNLHCANTSNKTPFCIAVETKNTYVVEMFQPHITLDQAVAMRDACIQQCGIDLVAQPRFALDTVVLPDVTHIVLHFLGMTKKRKHL